MAGVFVITGPSGVGKGTLIRGLMERLATLELSVSATTRAPREKKFELSHFRRAVGIWHRAHADQTIAQPPLQ